MCAFIRQRITSPLLSVRADALLEAALWMDEVRDLQALRDQLRSEIQELSTKWTQFKGEGSANRASPPAAATSTEAAVATSPSPSPGASPSPASASPSPSPSPANASPSPAAPSPTPSRDVPAEAFISNGPEFCPLTCQVCYMICAASWPLSTARFSCDC